VKRTLVANENLTNNQLSLGNGASYEVTNRKSHMSFRLVPKSVTLKGVMAVNFALFRKTSKNADRHTHRSIVSLYHCYDCSRRTFYNYESPCQTRV